MVGPLPEGRQNVAGLESHLMYILDIPELSEQAKEAVSGRRQQILLEIFEYYKYSAKDIALRLGNLVLLLIPIKVRFVELMKIAIATRN